ncbi:OB-fold nucleic acid binding domain-containing protein [Yinghuangia sp. ASG 101]|uniref:OB-fold nucleic acid binding domain-containing protein n=1 Tax=Yinghuangia sp. ASG 101 TaxID=2896848 RepID=UPI001E37D61A|nr:OB-fold nucleic acid binding domain-containing protein [Yinghuangia sp. ASG 101]UGQ13849.1 OB-fold nucleic acid binding domain-containing protein [Yinghuangia sp. ASG 101]
MSGTTGVEREPGRFRRMFNRLTSTHEELDAEELRQDSRQLGCTAIGTVAERDLVTVGGTLRTVTFRPRGGVPALEAELYDGSGALSVVWLGRRKIAGIEPGRQLVAQGRVSTTHGRPVLFNPKYELRPVGNG